MRVTIQTEDGSVIEGDLVPIHDGIRDVVLVPEEWVSIKQAYNAQFNQIVTVKRDSIIQWSVFAATPGEDVV